MVKKKNKGIVSTIKFYIDGEEVHREIIEHDKPKHFHVGYVVEDNRDNGESLLKWTEQPMGKKVKKNVSKKVS
jgi:hypothetical protein